MAARRLARFSLRRAEFRQTPRLYGACRPHPGPGHRSHTAVFSIVDALRPLPYKDPGRLAAVWITSSNKTYAL
ncbi:MAG TPA: hypothetical protein VGH38_02910 [Bryobacteraceae bacterium]